MTVSGAELGRIDISNVFICSALKKIKTALAIICPLCITHFTHIFCWGLNEKCHLGNLLDRMKPRKIGLYGNETWGLQANSTSFNSFWSMETNKVCLKSPGPQAEELQLSSFLHQHGGHPLKPAFRCLSGPLPQRRELLHCLSSPQHRLSYCHL